MDLCSAAETCLSFCSSANVQNFTFMDTSWGVIPAGVWFTFSLFVTARPVTEGPGHSTATYGVVAARRPPMDD